MSIYIHENNVYFEVMIFSLRGLQFSGSSLIGCPYGSGVFRRLVQVSAFDLRSQGLIPAAPSLTAAAHLDSLSPNYIYCVFFRYLW